MIHVCPKDAAKKVKKKNSMTFIVIEKSKIYFSVVCMSVSQ